MCLTSRRLSREPPPPTLQCTKPVWLVYFNCTVDDTRKLGYVA